jgi:ABC-2 type transport system ATP-binding protein
VPAPKKAEVESALEGVVGVKKVGELPTDERAHLYEVVSDREVDLRPELFKLVVDKGWVLLELHRDSQTLEDVFRSLTIGEERRNRRLGPDVDTADDEDDEDDGASRARRGPVDENVAPNERS